MRTELFLIGTRYLCDLIPQNVADTIGMKRNSRMKNMKGYLCEQPLLHHVRRDEKQTANVHCVLKRIKVNWETRKKKKKKKQPTFLFVFEAAPLSEELAVESIHVEKHLFFFLSDEVRPHSVQALH